jgi:hypothetical protein
MALLLCTLEPSACSRKACDGRGLAAQSWCGSPHHPRHRANGCRRRQNVGDMPRAGGMATWAARPSEDGTESELPACGRLAAREPESLLDLVGPEREGPTPSQEVEDEWPHYAHPYAPNNAVTLLVGHRPGGSARVWAHDGDQLGRGGRRGGQSPRSGCRRGEGFQQGLGSRASSSLEGQAGAEG